MYHGEARICSVVGYRSGIANRVVPGTQPRTTNREFRDNGSAECSARFSRQRWMADERRR